MGGTVKGSCRRGLARDGGFTLAELLVVLTVIGVLLLIAVAVYIPASQAAMAAACRHNQTSFERARSLAMSENAEAPDDLSDLAAYLSEYETISVCPEDGSPLVFDPDTGDVSCPNHP